LSKTLQRGTDYEEFERLAENVFNEYRDVIEDKQTFYVALEDFLYPNTKAINNPRLRKRTFDAYADKFNVSKKNEYSRVEALHKVAGGKHINRDRTRTAKTVYVDTRDGRHKYISTGAGKSDLDGLDTKDGKKISTGKLVKVKRFNYGFLGSVKGKSVYGRKDGKYYRDKKGRFIKVNKGSEK